jgi:hypothetical protein
MAARVAEELTTNATKSTEGEDATVRLVHFRDLRPSLPEEYVKCQELPGGLPAATTWPPRKPKPCEAEVEA